MRIHIITLPMLFFSFLALGQEPSRLVYLTAGHIRKKLPEDCQTCSVYTITAKSNKISLRIHESLFHGDIQKTFSRIDKSEILARSPYIIPECLQDDYRYLYAGDIFSRSKLYFEGLIIGVAVDPMPGKRVYLCSISRNNGKLPSDPQPHLGPFKVGYKILKGLEIYSVDSTTLEKLL